MYGVNYFACFLDQELFYHTSRCQKLKALPLGLDKDPIAVVLRIPTAKFYVHGYKNVKGISNLDGI